RVGALEVEAMALEPLQRRQIFFHPAIRPVPMVAFLVGHQHDDVRRLRYADGSTSDRGGDEPTGQTGHGGKSGSHLQHAAPRARLRGGRNASATGLPVLTDLAPALLEPVAPRKLGLHSFLPRTSRPSGRPAIYRCRMSLRQFPISAGEELSGFACRGARYEFAILAAKARRSERRRSATTWPFCPRETNLAAPRWAIRRLRVLVGCQGYLNVCVQACGWVCWGCARPP